MRPATRLPALLAFASSALMSSGAFAVDYDDTQAYCEALLEVSEAELAEDLAAGDVSAEEAALEREEMPTLAQCVCHWDMTRELAGADYTRRIQKIWLEGATFGELQAMDEEGLLDVPAGVDEEEASERIEADCGI